MLNTFTTLSPFPPRISLFTGQCGLSKISLSPLATETEMRIPLWADESKATNVQGPTVGPSTAAKRKRTTKQNDQAVDENAPGKKKGGRQPYENTAEYLSDDRYNRVPWEDKHAKERRLHWIWRH